MNREISFIVEFDEINENQFNKLNEFLEGNMIKFHILKSDSEFKENTNLKQALNKIREFINKFHTLQRSTYENQHILQIIDKVLGDDEE